ncbi:MAG: ribosome maturation factor RimP [Deltaproteobacteria bacterium]|nr:ribosome maturation factor RimP [Deltaproteobacteria bacterium]
MKNEIQNVVETVEDLIGSLIKAEGFELIEVQYRRERGGWVLRLFVDRSTDPDQPSDAEAPGSSITLDDCAAISREVGNLLEIKEVIQGPYNLEISSPGLDRPLKKPDDYIRFAGHLIRIKMKSPVDGRKKFKGRLLGLEDGLIKLDVDEQTIEVRLDETERVALEPEVNWGRA